MLAAVVGAIQCVIRSIKAMKLTVGGGRAMPVRMIRSVESFKGFVQIIERFILLHDVAAAPVTRTIRAVVRDIKSMEVAICFGLG